MVADLIAESCHLDLMIPGLVAGSDGLPDLKEGDVVAICINGYK